MRRGQYEALTFQMWKVFFGSVLFIYLLVTWEQESLTNRFISHPIIFFSTSVRDAPQAKTINIYNEELLSRLLIFDLMS